MTDSFLIFCGFRGHFFDQIKVWRLTFLDFGITFLMKLRSGGLLFREEGDHGRFWSLGARSRGGEYAPGRLGLHFGNFFDQKTIKNRCIC